MPQSVLVLGGTTEARALCRAMAEAGIPGTLSLAGRVARPADQALPVRVGGFGGVPGLSAYLAATGVSHVIDATHPFAAQMSRNAALACAETGVALAALSRPPWQARPGDRWEHVPDIAAAVAALDRPALRVFLAVGRMHLPAFEARPQHSYLLRLVDPPVRAPGFPRHRIILDRGPFTEAADRKLLQEARIGLVVSKNSGGSGAVAKIDAARALGLRVLMIDRPALPARQSFGSVAGIMAWLTHAGTDLGV